MKPKFNHTEYEVAGIGFEAGLEGNRLTLFVQYMVARGFDKSATSYVQEWAGRFACGAEWEASDGKGQKVLKGLHSALEKFARGEFKNGKES